MKTRILCFLLLVCGLSFSAAAQNNPSQYKLRELSAGEYLDGILSTMSGPADFDNSYFPQLIGDVLFDEYPNLENENWEKLLKVYDWLGVGTLDLGFNRDRLNIAIIHAWLRENKVDLSKSKQLQFADYDISITPRDFNDDGVNEYLLDVVKGAKGKIDRDGTYYEAEYVDYLVAQGKENYHILRPQSSQWHGTSGWPQDPVKGGAIEARFEDINADGLPEWLVIDGGNITGGMGQYVCSSSLHIYGWRNGQLVDLTPRRGLGYQGEHFSGGGCTLPTFRFVWDLANVDDDPAMEILQHAYYLDNWYCSVSVTDEFDWDAGKDQYVFKQTNQVLADTQNCLQRQAEELMWKGDSAAPIPLYEKALSLPPYQTDSEWQQDDLKELNQYLRIRLALAYILSAQQEKARPLLQQLQSETYKEDTIRDFVSVLSLHIDDPLRACSAAFNIFTEYAPNHIYGVTNKEHFNYGVIYFPERIACDAPNVIQSYLADHSLRTDQSPVDQLKAIGIDTQKVLRFDLDHDGHEEWLIWPKVPMSPLFFAPDGDVYQESQITINPYLKPGEFSTHALPDDAGEAIIFKPDELIYDNDPPWYGNYDPQYAIGGGGEPSECITAGRKSQKFIQFQLWRMDNKQLVHILWAEVCRDSVEELFGDHDKALQLDGGTVQNDMGDHFENFDLKYEWDNAEKKYKLIVNPTPTPLATATPTPQPKYYRVSDAFNKHDYAAVVEMTEHLLVEDYKGNGNYAVQMLTGDYYLRALALQHLGREQEAIEAFLKMIEVAPDEHWKKLAMLYLEPV